MEDWMDDENAIYVSSLHATAAEWRATAQVFMERISEADAADAVKLKADAESYIKIAELLEERGVKCLADLPTLH